MRRPGPHALVAVLAVTLLVVGVVPSTGRSAAPNLSPGAVGNSTLAPAPGDWPMYLHDVDRSSANLVDRGITPSNVGNLTKVWSFATHGAIAASPIVVRGTVYVGSWDGYEYALNASTGVQEWATFLGKLSNPRCTPASLGVTSTATWEDGVLYVGGGAGYWFALNALNGSVEWDVFTGNTSSYYNWGSPLIVGNRAYVGLASDCDNPLVRAAVLEISLTTHVVVGTFYTVGIGRLGASIWSSPAYDARTRSIFVTTGNALYASQALGQAFVSLSAGTLSLQGSWKVPSNRTGPDSDFGATPTFINGAGATPLLVATNKNGVAYALARDNLSAGPVWTARIAAGGPCPECGDGSISSGSYANKTLFLGGGEVTLGSTNYSGSIQAIWPSNGSIRWQDGLSAPVIPALSYDDGLVFAGVGKTLRAFNARTGAQELNYSTKGTLYGPSAIAHGCVYFGSTDDSVYALGPPGSSCTVTSSSEHSGRVGSPRLGPGPDPSAGPIATTGPAADRRSAGAPRVRPAPALRRG